MGGILQSKYSFQVADYANTGEDLAGWKGQREGGLNTDINSLPYPEQSSSANSINLAALRKLLFDP